MKVENEGALLISTSEGIAVVGTGVSSFFFLVLRVLGQEHFFLNFSSIFMEILHFLPFYITPISPMTFIHRQQRPSVIL